MQRKEIGWGILLSYFLIFLNTIYNLVMVPYILTFVDVGTYGVYKSVAAISASLAIMDLGLGATTTRYICRYSASGDKRNAKNFFAMVLVQFAVLSIAILCVGGVFFASIDRIYRHSFTQSEIILAQKLLVLLILTLVLRLLENILAGVVKGHERFRVFNAAKLSALTLKMVLLLVVLPMTRDVMTIAYADLIITLIEIAVFSAYIAGALHVAPCLYSWDKALFAESIRYSMLAFIQAFTVQMNGNIDNILIGAMVSSAAVTVYSAALAVFNMYEMLSSTVSDMMLPQITKEILHNADQKRLQQVVAQIGRFQFFLIGGVLGAFVVLGKDFFLLWLGEGFSDCYFLTLMLIVPVTLSLIQNAALAILRAQNKMGYRTITLAVSTVLNLFVSLWGLAQYGYWGAALGTMVASISNCVFMNLYYHKKTGFLIRKLYSDICSRTWVCICIAALSVGVLRHWLNSSLLSFLVNASVYILIYGVLLVNYGLSAGDKKIILYFVGR